MERRALLQSIGSVLAVALAPSLPGCGTIGGPDLSSFVDLTRIGDRLRDAVAKVRGSPRLPRVSKWLGDRGIDEEMPTRMLSSLWIASTFRDLPPKVRRDPEVQQWLKEELPQVAATTFEVAEMLEGLTPAERDQFTGILREEPDLHEQLAAGFEAHRPVDAVEPERVRQVCDVTAHVVWRARNQSLSAVIDDYVERVERACRRSRIERADWRAGIAAELPLWQALDIVTDPDSLEAQEAAEGMDVPEAVASLTREGAYLGVAVSHGRSPRGVRVEHVHRDSPAFRAGLLAEDRIEAVNGQKLSSSQLVAWLGTRDGGEPVELEVRRGGEHHTLHATLQAGPGDRLFAPNRAGVGMSSRARYLSTGAKIAGIGLRIMAGGAIMFLVGLLLIAAGGGVEGAVGGVGAFLTIAGVIVVGIGLVVLLVAGLAAIVDAASGPVPEDAG